MDKKLVDKIILIVIFFVVLIFVYLWVKGIDETKKKIADREYKIEGKNILLVIAHPDDEAMFFMPTLYNLKEQGKNLYILCLSDGGYYDKGDIRKVEFEKSCRALEVKAFEVGEFKDGAQWDEVKIMPVIESKINLWKIDTIITFDKEGITGHKNHISCYNTVRWIRHVKKYELITAKTEPVITYILPDNKHAEKHMKIHHSQYTWYRKFFIKYSKYTTRNDLALIE